MDTTNLFEGCLLSNKAMLGIYFKLRCVIGIILTMGLLWHDTNNVTACCVFLKLNQAFITSQSMNPGGYSGYLPFLSYSWVSGKRASDGNVLPSEE